MYYELFGEGKDCDEACMSKKLLSSRKLCEVPNPQLPSMVRKKLCLRGDTCPAVEHKNGLMMMLIYRALSPVNNEQESQGLLFLHLYT